MKKIPLTKGYFVAVDDEDYDYLMQWKWCFHKGYAVRNAGGRKYILMHRIINETPDGYQTDHVNMDKLDNRRCNLRSVTRGENNLNRPAARNSTSKYKGVCWDKLQNKWHAQIKPLGLPRMTLGYFTCEVNAAQAYNLASAIYNGDKARINGGDLSAGKQ